MHSEQLEMQLKMLQMLQMLQQEVQKSSKPSDVAELKDAGARVYRAVLNTEPERVEFTSSGIKFR